jgi:hypothetical protein
MSFCSNCGAEVKEGQAVCLSCGFELKQVRSGKSAKSRGWFDIQNRNGKERGPAFVFALFLAGLGAHRFYLDADWKVTMLLVFLAGIPTLGATWIISSIWGLIDFVRIVAADEETFEHLFLKAEEDA